MTDDISLFLKKAGWTSKSKGSGSCSIETCVQTFHSRFLNSIHIPTFIFLPASSQPKMKEKMLAKYEFSGNRRLPGLSLSGRSGPGPSRSRSRSGTPDAQSQSQSQSARGRGEGGRGRRGQNRGRGRGRGRGATAGPGAGDGGDAQSQAWKNKNKARQGNHDRKRGHDRKMGKAGGPSG